MNLIKPLNRLTAKLLDRGFTLLEVILVIAILAIISTISFSYLGGFKTSSELDETAGQIVGKLREAQSKAMTGEDGKKWGVHFDNAGSDSSYDFFSTTNSYASGSAIVETIYLTHLAQGVTFSMPAAGQSVDVIFSKITGVPAVAQNVVISLQNSTKTIIVETSGRIHVQ